MFSRRLKVVAVESLLQLTTQSEFRPPKFVVYSGVPGRIPKFSEMSDKCPCAILEDGFGLVPRPCGGRPNEPSSIVRRYTMTNKSGARVQLISWGAGIQSVKVPSRSGNLADVVLGFDDMDGYLENRYMGGMIGPLASSVTTDKMRCTARFDAGDACRDSKSCTEGFDNVNWESHIVNEQVVMSHLRRESDGIGTSNMLVQVKFNWTDESQLHINIRASSTKATPVDITNRCLFNLAGHGAGMKELRKHVAAINAHGWASAEAKGSLPTGVIHPVKRTALDLRLPTQLTRRKLLEIPGGGYEHDLCVTSPTCWCYRFHARILHPGTGRTLEIYSNQPGLHFYTGNDLPVADRIYPPDLEDCAASDTDFQTPRKCDSEICESEIIGKGGVPYSRHAGFAASPQNYPEAYYVENFPSCMLYPGKIYVHDMTYKFGVLTA